MPTPYLTPGPTREEINETTGPKLLEFCTNWCGYCQGAAPLFAEPLLLHPTFQHIKIEAEPGRHLGRSFSVKLLPTAIFLKDGLQVTRAV